MHQSELRNSQTEASFADSGSQTPTSMEKDLQTVKSEIDLERRLPQTKDEGASTPAPDSPYTTAADWDGPDDPGDPLNWPMAKKVYHTAITAALSFVVTYGSSTYAPGIYRVADEFHVSEEVAILGLTLYVLGLGLGPVVAGGCSETFGRKAVYLWAPPLSLLFTMGAGLSKNITSLLITRFLAGATGAGPLAVGAGTNSDIWSPLDRSTAASIWLLAPFFGPALGPATASYLIQDVSWRWGQWLVICAGGFVWVLSLLQHETYKKAILKARAKKYNLPGPPDPLPPGFAKVKALVYVTVVRAMKMLLTEPICTAFSVYASFCFGVLFAFFTGVTWVFRTVYDFNVGEAGLVFISIGVGCVIGTITQNILDRKVYRRKLLVQIKNGGPNQLPPEERLYAAMIGAILLPISLFWFAWSARSDVPWIVPTVALGVFGAGNMLVFVTTVLYLVDTYGPMYGASAMSANSLARYAIGAVFPLFAVQMFRNLTIKWAGSLLGFVTVAMLPIPFLFYRYGKTIRSHGSIPKSSL